MSQPPLMRLVADARASSKEEPREKLRRHYRHHEDLIDKTPFYLNQLYDVQQAMQEDPWLYSLKGSFGWDDEQITDLEALTHHFGADKQALEATKKSFAWPDDDHVHQFSNDVSRPPWKQRSARYVGAASIGIALAGGIGSDLPLIGAGALASTGCAWYAFTYTRDSPQQLADHIKHNYHTLQTTLRRNQ